MNLLQMALTRKIASKAQSVFRRLSRQQDFRPCQDFLPLGIEAYRQARLEFRRRDRTDKRETSSKPGASRRYQDVRVQHNSQGRRFAHDKIRHTLTAGSLLGFAAQLVQEWFHRRPAFYNHLE